VYEITLTNRIIYREWCPCVHSDFPPFNFTDAACRLKWKKWIYHKKRNKEKQFFTHTVIYKESCERGGGKTLAHVFTTIHLPIAESILDYRCKIISKFYGNQHDQQNRHNNKVYKALLEISKRQKRFCNFVTMWKN